MDKGTPAEVAGHAESPATSVEAGVWVDPDLYKERAGRLLVRVDILLHRRRAAQSLQLQEPVGQEAHGGVVVKARPRAPLEVVQPQLFFELLIALLDVPAALPQL